MNPPSRSLRSIRATDHPALASSAAATRPFTPDPTTTASNVLAMSSPLRGVANRGHSSLICGLGEFQYALVELAGRVEILRGQTDMGEALVGHDMRSAAG